MAKRILFVLGCFVASLVGGVLGALLLQPGPQSVHAQDDNYKVVSANRFLLMDTNGKARGALTTDKSTGAPKLMFLEADGTRRMSLAIGPDGNPYINLLNDAKQNAIDVSVKPDGSSAVVLRGADGSNAGSWACIKAKDGSWQTVLESGLVNESMR